MTIAAAPTIAANLLSINIDLVKAAVLGLVEGLTEFLPVSSTGHLLLMEQVLGWGGSDYGKSFAILIQLGAILALLTIYFARLWTLATRMFTQWEAARFVIGVLIAFLPAAVIGALTYQAIKTYLFDVRVVCIALIVGGFVLLLIDRLHPADVFRHRAVSMLVHHSGRLASGRDDRRRHAARRRPPFGGGVFILACHAHHGRCFRLRSIQEPRRTGQRQPCRHCGGFHMLVHLRLDRRQDVPQLRAAPHLRAVRLVAHRGRHRRPHCPLSCIARRSACYLA